VACPRIVERREGHVGAAVHVSQTKYTDRVQGYGRSQRGDGIGDSFICGLL